MTTWQVSVDAATEEAPQARSLIGLLAYLAPDGTPIDWLLDDSRTARDEAFRCAPVDLDQALAALDGYSLVDVRPRSDDAPIPGDHTYEVSIHRVVQSATRRMGGPGDGAAAVRLLHRQVAGDPEDPESWPVLGQLARHVGYVLAESPNVLRAEPVLGLIVVKDVSVFHRSSGNVKAAIEVGQTNVELAGEYFGARDKATLAARQNLADGCRAAGDRTRAIEILEGVLSDCHAMLDATDSVTLGVRNSLAGAYEDHGESLRAIRLYEPLVDDSLSSLGPDALKTLGAQQNLAKAYVSVGDIARAIQIYEEVLPRLEKVLGPADRRTLGTRANLEFARRKIGGHGVIERSEGLHEEMVEALGPDHPAVLGQRHRHAASLEESGDLAGAIEAYESLRTDCVRVLGREHPESMGVGHNLAVAYATVGDGGRAIAVYEELLPVCRSVFQHDDPEMLIAQIGLADAYHMVGDESRATEVYERILPDCVRAFGETAGPTNAVRFGLLQVAAVRRPTNG